MGGQCNSRTVVNSARAATLGGITQPLMTLQDMGEHMKDCPFIGWTIRECIASITANIRIHAALMPTPTDPKAATMVRALLREGQAALDALDEGVELIDTDFDCGMKRGSGVAALGAAIESLALKAGTAFESAAASMGANEMIFCFYESPKKELKAA